MKFSYTATQIDGKVVKGIEEAQTKEEVLDFLIRQELKPIAIKPARFQNMLADIFSFGQGITPTDKIFLTKYLALMLKAGTDLFKALDILVADFKKPAVKYLLVEIRRALEKGQPFYVTFAKYPGNFSPIFINLIKAGEVSGNLDATFDNLSVMLEKEEDLKRKIRSALIYPTLLLIASATVLGFLVTFALPRIAEVFSQLGEPPTFSRVVFAVGLFIARNIYIIGALLLFGSAAGYFYFFKTKVGRRQIFKFLSYVPVINTVIQRVAIQRFAITLGYLLKAGVPIVDALTLTATAIGNDRIANSLKRIAIEGVARGLTIGEAFRREADFPLVITNLIAVSEKAGHLEEILFILSTFYESEIEAAIKGMVSLIEPAMLIVIGGIVGLIAMSIIVPIYQLVGQL